MLTPEDYTFLNGFKPALKLFYEHGEYIGGCDAVFDWNERKFNVQIDRGCPGCKSGFLKSTYSMILKYEEQNGSR